MKGTLRSGNKTEALRPGGEDDAVGGEGTAIFGSSARICKRESNASIDFFMYNFRIKAR